MKTVAFLVLVFSLMVSSALAVNVPGTSDPWLAGMPDGSTASLEDVAPDQSPVLVPGLSLAPGLILTFSASGGVSNGPAIPLVGPDGDTFWSHSTGAENGISNIVTPINGLVGVFLDNNQPNFSPEPALLDFFILGLNFTSLAPELKQVFFIGDGLTAASQVQQFVVPTNATRLFLGTMDGFGWWNNQGSFDVQVAVIPLPGAFWLLGSGLLGLLGFGRRLG
jgi:hypothetical protein